jgi:hypothetical protein
VLVTAPDLLYKTPRESKCRLKCKCKNEGSFLERVDRPVSKLVVVLELKDLCVTCTYTLTFTRTSFAISRHLFKHPVGRNRFDQVDQHRDNRPQNFFALDNFVFLQHSFCNQNIQRGSALEG